MYLPAMPFKENNYENRQQTYYCDDRRSCLDGLLGAGCLSETGDSQANTEQVSVASGQNDPYVSDDACLGCHGGTYESVAARTESYGDSNPHDSVHGGYLSCNVCHARGNEVTSNYCLECHDWPRDLDCNPYD